MLELIGKKNAVGGAFHFPSQAGAFQSFQDWLKLRANAREMVYGLAPWWFEYGQLSCRASQDPARESKEMQWSSAKSRGASAGRS